MGNALNSLFGSEDNTRVSFESAGIQNSYQWQVNPTAQEAGTGSIREVNNRQSYERPILNSYRWQVNPEMVKTEHVVKQNQNTCTTEISKQFRSARNHYTLLINSVLLHAETRLWTPDDYTIRAVSLHHVSNTCSEYAYVSKLFKSTNQKCYKITSIDRIQNPYLMFAFLLKKEDMKKRLGYTPEVQDLFHGTKRTSVDSICENNFDWRRCGEHVGTKFGQGVSFSPISNYATHYSDEDRVDRVMLLVKVLVGNKCPGEKNMILPSDGCDTTEKDNGHVIVKYEDNEFYPAYKITYDFTGKFIPKNRYRKNRNVNLN